MSDLCDKNCNHCPLLAHRNTEMLTEIFNVLLKKFGNGVYEVVQKHCPNLTVCHECRIDDFVHIEGCHHDKELQDED